MQDLPQSSEETLPVSSGGDENSIKVLDHGFVRLVDAMGSDLSIVRAARVSYNAEWRSGESENSDARLINYLWRNRHTSPFESVVFTFEVKAPIFVFRQWHRHRTWSFNEVSARYTELPEEYYTPQLHHIGVQSTSSKQARVISNFVDDTHIIKAATEIDFYKNIIDHNFQAYKMLLEKGWPRELARAILPVSTYSRMFCTVDLLNLFKFIELRLHQHAQWEIQQYGQALLDLIIPVAPIACEAFNKTREKKDVR